MDLAKGPGCEPARAQRTASWWTIVVIVFGSWARTYWGNHDGRASCHCGKIKSQSENCFHGRESPGSKELKRVYLNILPNSAFGCPTHDLHGFSHLRYNEWAKGVYERICGKQKTRKKKAAVALARKIAVLAWAMLRDEKDWEPKPVVSIDENGHLMVVALDTRKHSEGDSVDHRLWTNGTVQRGRAID